MMYIFTFDVHVTLENIKNIHRLACERMDPVTCSADSSFVIYLCDFVTLTVMVNYHNADHAPI